MSVFVYTETLNGKLKKNAFEVASYAYELAQKTGSEVVAIAFNADSCEDLFNYGVSKVLHVKNDLLSTFNAKVYAHVIAKAASDSDAKMLVVSSSTDAKYMASILSARLGAGYVPNVVAAPLSMEPLTLKRMTFSNKGFAHTKISTEIKIIGVSNNSFGLVENPVSGSVEDYSPEVGEVDFNTKSESVERVTGKITIADADMVEPFL